MSYDLNNLSLRALEKIRRVMDEIDSRVELLGKYNEITFNYNNQEIDGISAREFEYIFKHLRKDGPLEKSIQDYQYDDRVYFLTVNPEAFYPFLDDVRKRINELEKGTLSESVKNEIPLCLNLRTGDFSFYNTKGNFSPAGQEFKVLKTLYEDKDHQAKYLALIQSYRPLIEEATKGQKDDLYLIIRNIKEVLNILPATETSNQDVFKNIKSYGYRLIFNLNEIKPE